MITATDLELRAGARILLEPTTLRVQPGDRIGLVGRNGAGKTSTLRAFAGEALPHAGRVHRSGPVGYLPQDPRTGDLDVVAHCNYPTVPAKVLPIRLLGFDSRQLLGTCITHIDQARRGESVPDMTVVPALFEDEVVTRKPDAMELSASVSTRA